MNDPWQSQDPWSDAAGITMSRRSQPVSVSLSAQRRARARCTAVRHSQRHSLSLLRFIKEAVVQGHDPILRSEEALVLQDLGCSFLPLDSESGYNADEAALVTLLPTPSFPVLPPPMVSAEAFAKEDETSIEHSIRQAQSYARLKRDGFISQANTVIGKLRNSLNGPIDVPLGIVTSQVISTDQQKPENLKAQFETKFNSSDDEPTEAADAAEVAEAATVAALVTQQSSPRVFSGSEVKEIITQTRDATIAKVKADLEEQFLDRLQGTVDKYESTIAMLSDAANQSLSGLRHRMRESDPKPAVKSKEPPKLVVAPVPDANMPPVVDPVALHFKSCPTSSAIFVYKTSTTLADLGIS